MRSQKGFLGAINVPFHHLSRVASLKKVSWWGGNWSARLIVIIIHNIICHPLCFHRAPRAPTGVCLVCGFSLITSPSLGLEVFHVAFPFSLPFEWKLF